MVWFEYIISGLAKIDTPVPLGGTSNHFKMSALKKVGYWDAYNVTEDAELGIRLYLNQYKTDVIDSYTLEESPVYYADWLNQRTRWIKGFIQTFLVFIFYKDKRNYLSIKQIAITYIFLGLSTYNFLITPYIILALIFNTLAINKYFAMILLGFLCVSYIKLSFVLYNQQNFKNTDNPRLGYIAIIIRPFYFILHTIAGYKVLIDVAISPFRWAKTWIKLFKKY